MSTRVDVTIVGGGVQGLVALDRLMNQGYACALVTDGDIGAGQTLHSHGVLNSGFGMVGDRLQRTAQDIVEPYLHDRGVPLGGEWLVIPPPGVPVADAAEPAALPAGFDRSIAERVARIPDRRFDKRRLVSTLMDGRQDRIVRGRARLNCDGARVRGVAVQREAGAPVDIESRVVIVAAGCGSKRLVEDVVGPTPQTQRVKHRRVHMLCVRGPRGSLPAVCVAAMPLALMLVGHEREHDVTWYVTPMEFGGPSYDDVAPDAASDVQPDVAGRALEALLRLYPAVAETAEVRVGCYAGYRQDVGDLPGVEECGVVEGTDNLVLALPSGLIGPWANATALVRIVADIVSPSGAQPPLPEGGVGVRVGMHVEDRPGFAWLALEEWRRLPVSPEGMPGSSR